MRHAAHSEGGELARRYQPSIVPFAAARDDSEDSLRALGALAKPDEDLVLIQADEIVVPRGFVAVFTATGVRDRFWRALRQKSQTNASSG